MAFTGTVRYGHGLISPQVLRKVTGGTGSSFSTETDHETLRIAMSCPTFVLSLQSRWCCVGGGSEWSRFWALNRQQHVSISAYLSSLPPAKYLLPPTAPGVNKHSRCQVLWHPSLATNTLGCRLSPCHTALSTQRIPILRSRKFGRRISKIGVFNSPVYTMLPAVWLL